MITKTPLEFMFRDPRHLLETNPDELRSLLEALLLDPPALDRYCKFRRELACERPPRPGGRLEESVIRAIVRHGLFHSAVSREVLAALLDDPETHLLDLQWEVFSTEDPESYWYRKREVDRAPATRGDFAASVHPTLINTPAGSDSGSESILAGRCVGGRYHLVSLIGKGGMGTVWKAEDRQLGRTVALKICLPESAGATRFQRMVREIHALERVQHPHVCPVLDSGCDGGEPFIVQPFIQGTNLRGVLNTVGPLPPPRAVDLILKIAGGLDAAHRAQIIHRDVKPENILINESGQPLLIDFGLARLREEVEPQTREGTVLGTLGYMAPEQAFGRPDQIGPWSDVYSLGVVLDEMLTGRQLPTNPAFPESDERLKAIIHKATARHPADRFRNVEEMVRALRGWLSNPHAPPAGSDLRVSWGHLPKTDRHLIDRQHELAMLTAFWDDLQHKNIVCLVAPGGMGKSALVTHWLARMAGEQYRGARAVYVYSFYRDGSASQVTSDHFLAHALQWFNDPNPEAGLPEAKGERLLELVRTKRTLLVLDGLEPLQDRSLSESAPLRDPALSRLITGLAAFNPGLCVITTRVRVLDIEPFASTTSPVIELNQLSPQAGAELLRELGVRGPEEELRRASAEYSGHPLALTLLGSYLKRFCRGDVARRDQIQLPGDEEQIRRVMESYEKQFEGLPELAMLRLIGLFNGPADRKCLESLCSGPTIAGLTEALEGLSPWEWESVLHRLRDDALVVEVDADQPDLIDAHPLVRAFFGQQLRNNAAAAWREGHRRIYHYLRSLEGPELPRTAEQMKRHYQTVYHGCQADLHQEALREVYWWRIAQKNIGYSTRVLGMFSADLAMFSYFFETPWTRPLNTLDENWRAFLPGLAGSRLRALGRLQEAVAPVRKSLEEYRKSGVPWWAAHEARHLSELFLFQGQLQEAADFGRQAVALADQGRADESSHVYQRYAARAVLGAACTTSVSGTGPKPCSAMPRSSCASTGPSWRFFILFGASAMWRCWPTWTLGGSSGSLRTHEGGAGSGDAGQRSGGRARHHQSGPGSSGAGTAGHAPLAADRVAAGCRGAGHLRPGGPGAAHPRPARLLAAGVIGPGRAAPANAQPRPAARPTFRRRSPSPAAAA